MAIVMPDCTASFRLPANTVVTPFRRRIVVVRVGCALRIVRINRVAAKYDQIKEGLVPLNNTYAGRDQRARLNYLISRINGFQINKLLLYLLIREISTHVLTSHVFS